MTMTTQQYANLAQDSYDSPDLSSDQNRRVNIGGIRYTILAHVDKESGYQGTIYQREDTKEIVVAHRGSEFKEQPFKDGVLADGGMVAKRVNAQAADAIEFTRAAIEMAKARRDETGMEPQVTVTGHSLGGCLAQITAAKLNLNGETFNPYGAVSLGLRIPEGGSSVMNHVMAGDVVSAASKHFGKVTMYAEPVELNVLKASGYEDNGSQLDIRNPIKAAVTGGDSHRMHHFLDVDGKGQPDRSILSQPQARELADRHRPLFEKYRGDIEDIRAGATLGAAVYRGSQAIADEIRRHLPESSPESPFRDAHGALPAHGRHSLDPRDAGHPNRAMHQAIHTGVEHAFASKGLQVGESSDRTSAALLVNARQNGLSQVDQVVPGRQTAAGLDVFAVQGDVHDPAHKRAQVNTQVAAQIPVETSFQQLATVNQQLAASQEQHNQDQARTQAARTV
ncbi:XVIPCD domain-containing protein [Lysobacter firmicutimachus]|uniref:XVIPCD domain-containing protein n=1 Tax=Lysobacter firmicutimachus TaxID=1792846 RepID=A0AAU8MUM4_9GAMM|nr:XVIPCD domain-containing protein [Lysobacter antibioticus]